VIKNVRIMVGAMQIKYVSALKGTWDSTAKQHYAIHSV
jgi:hypothetical protein